MGPWIDENAFASAGSRSFAASLIYTFCVSYQMGQKQGLLCSIERVTLISSNTQTCSIPSSQSHSKRSTNRGMGTCGFLRVRKPVRYSQSQSAIFLSTPKQRFRLGSCRAFLYQNEKVLCSAPLCPSMKRSNSKLMDERKTYMGQDDYSIAGKMHIRLDSVRSSFHRCAHSLEAVFGPCRLVASVGYGLRQEEGWV